MKSEYRYAKARYDGSREFSLEEIPVVAEWLGVSVSQLTTGVRDRDRDRDRNGWMLAS